MSVYVRSAGSTPVGTADGQTLFRRMCQMQFVYNERFTLASERSFFLIQFGSPGFLLGDSLE